MKRFAIIENSVVANIAEAEGPLADNWVEASRGVNRGDSYDAEAGFGPAAPAPAPTLDQVRAEGARRLAAIAAEYSPEERETWAVQVDEARAVLADPDAPTPMLAPLAAARGLPIAEMAGVVLTKAGGFAAASGAILAAQSILIGTDPIPADYAADHHWPSNAA